jgi:hypothetical protein
MADIYNLAVFTIVAAAGNDAVFGLPGTGRHGRHSATPVKDLLLAPSSPRFMVDVGRSVWNERAWTYQEYILSRRCIFLTSHQAYFQCREDLWEEFFGGEGINSKLGLEETQLLSNGAAPIDQYKRAVMEYNTRHKTFPSDILDAFSGIRIVLAQRMDTSLYHALPELFFRWALL